ncbi:MAG: HAD-IA family hydrolase [Calditrichia bacterium]
MNTDRQSIPDVKKYKAMILDLDGVVTQTSRVHARAWKEIENKRPGFDPESCSFPPDQKIAGNKNGVDAYEGAVEHIKMWREKGLKIAVVSSSRNCAQVLEAAGITDLFDVRVDGVTAREEKLKGKPQPDLFLDAARKLGVEPEHAVVYEDAVAGVQAGHAGKFGLVIGIARTGNDDDLKENGADIVIHNFDEL